MNQFFIRIDEKAKKKKEQLISIKEESKRLYSMNTKQDLRTWSLVQKSISEFT